jgi:hypothetical protein
VLLAKTVVDAKFFFRVMLSLGSFLCLMQNQLYNMLSYLAGLLWEGHSSSSTHLMSRMNHWCPKLFVSRVVCVKNSNCFARNWHTGVYFSAVLCKDKFMQKNIVLFDFWKTLEWVVVYRCMGVCVFFFQQTKHSIHVCEEGSGELVMWNQWKGRER